MPAETSLPAGAGSATTPTTDRPGEMLASHEDSFPPLRPAAAFCAVLPPRSAPLLCELWLLPLLFPPRLEEPGEFETPPPATCSSPSRAAPRTACPSSRPIHGPQPQRPEASVAVKSTIPSADGLLERGRQHATAAPRKATAHVTTADRARVASWREDRPPARPTRRLSKAYRGEQGLAPAGLRPEGAGRTRERIVPAL